MGNVQAFLVQTLSSGELADADRLVHRPAGQLHIKEDKENVVSRKKTKAEWQRKKEKPLRDLRINP